MPIKMMDPEITRSENCYSFWRHTHGRLRAVIYAKIDVRQLGTKI